MSHARVAVVGSYGVGLTFELHRVPERGETVTGDTFRADPGGKGSNQAVGAARLGAQVDFLTAVGDDDFGEAALALWRDEGVRADAVVRVPLPTMVGAILVEPAGHNRIVIVPGALSALAPPHVDGFAEPIAAADILLVQLEIPVETAWRALAVAREAGVRTVLNPAPAPREPLAAEMVALADYLTPNETEAASIGGAVSAATSVVLTLGDEGARIEGEHVPAFSARPVDTTGAGDAFNAAFAVALAEGRSDREAVRWGCAAGAHNVEHAGVIAGLPRREELECRLEGAAVA
ncbi:MAG: ribokinase [Actinomycetota bacterium]|nr:ribokinase [Actinomycetota bacterium]